VEPAGRRGPRPGRSIHEIGEAAVAVADRDGLAAVSMKAVAEALGLTTMSLYRYVDSKDELFEVMLDVAYGTPDPALTSRGGWRHRLDRWARAIAAARLEHPWSVQVPLTKPPATPNVTRWTEAGLRAFSGTALTGQQKLSSLLLVDGYVSQHVRLSLQMGFLGPVAQAAPPDAGTFPENVLALAPPDEVALLREAAMSAVGDEDEDFFATELDFGLRTILDGIAQIVDRQGARRA
jgi:AcrR family transcriptional regulator